MASCRPLAALVLAAALAVPLAAGVDRGAVAVAEVSPSVREKVAEEFPGAAFPAQEQSMCTPAEHSFYGPTSYCFAEFTLGDSWNMVEVAVPALSGPGSAVSIYGHSSWQRRWTRCGFRLRVPGKDGAPARRLHIPGELTSNENCGLGQPEQPLVETDGDLFELEAWPRIRARKPLRAVTRAFIYSSVAAGLARYRVSVSEGVYTFTNSLGDSFRYTPYRTPRG